MKTFISFRGAVVQVNGFSDRNAELEQIKNVVINVLFWNAFCTEVSCNLDFFF